MRRFSVWVGGLLHLAVLAQVDTRTLDQGWEFREKGTGNWFAADVPGVIHTDLIRHGLIPDPYVAFNADSVQWVHERNWTYRTAFHLSSADLEAKDIDLVFEGLDTYADIVVNGNWVMRTDNMFRSWEIGTKHLLRTGTNTVEVTFRDPVVEGQKVKDRYGEALPADSDPSGVAPFVRKAAYQFGWDFAPRMLTCGIWRPVHLRLSGEVGPFDMKVEEHWSGKEVDLELRPRWKKGQPSSGDEGLEWVVWWDGEEAARRRWSRPGSENQTLSFRVDGSGRWWPKGSGPSIVHQLRVEVIRNGIVLCSWERSIGFRKVELDQAEDDRGKAFRFLVNEQPIFMRGCNLVPPDMFLPRAGDSAWVALVKHMSDGHMNMVRVWSGGVYPPEAFFNACDTAGILVWQDLMFGNMVPGSDSAFLATSLTEVAEHVDRISEHPSLALFCGNNELDVAWYNWGWQDRYGLHGADSSKVWDDHKSFFHERLRLATSPWTYTHTSPLSNWGNAEGLRNGDLHYWGVWHGDSTFASFAGNVGRFVSEYGFQSYPDSSHLARYIPPEQLHIGSPALSYRQRSYRTDRPIWDAIRHELGMVPTSLGGFISASQQVQAKAYERAITEHWKAWPACMGTLLWQLNEPWPGPSWSIVDHRGSRKPAYFSVKEAYRTILGGTAPQKAP